MSRGGWRYGAGRPGRKRKAEECCRLDVRLLHRAGHLTSGTASSWEWTVRGNRVASIRTRAEPMALWLVPESGDFRRPQRVVIDSTVCTYGGKRFWFACPLCGRRAAILYLCSGVFRCRRCNDVAYASQSEDAIVRAWRKQRQAEGKLRKNGIHQSTKSRLASVVSDCETVRDAALLGWARRNFLS